MERLRGVNFGGWFSQLDAIEEKDPKTFPGVDAHLTDFLHPSDFSRVKEWGFNHVRLPVDYTTVFAEEPIRPLEDRLNLLAQAIEGIRARGLQVILDLHRCPGHDFHAGATRPQAFFSDPACRADAKRVWAVLAERFGQDTGVFLEILNEPVAPEAETWNEIAGEMLGEIRRHAPAAPVVMASNRWNHAGEFARLRPLEDDRVLYSFHYYQPLIFTHQKAPWIGGEHLRETRTYPGTYRLPGTEESQLPFEEGRWDRARMEASLEPVFAFRDRHGVPVACNEFGTYIAGPAREDRLRWMEDLLSLLEAHGIGWSYWNYKNLDFGLVSVGESLFAGTPAYDNPERTDHEVVALLQRF